MSYMVYEMERTMNYLLCRGSASDYKKRRGNEEMNLN